MKTFAITTLVIAVWLSAYMWGYHNGMCDKFHRVGNRFIEENSPIGKDCL